MKVLHTPFFEGNQYQEELVKSLDEQGVDSFLETYALPFSMFLHRVVLGKIDVLHLHWLHPYFLFGSKRWVYRIPFNQVVCILAAVVFVLQVRLAGRFTRVVWTAHNLVNHEHRYKNLDRWVTNQVAAYADEIQVWDPRTRKELSNYASIQTDKTRIIPHGNYCNRYDRVDRYEAREHLGIQSDERVYLYFGVIRPYKGVPELLREFDKRAGTLIVAGQSKYEELEAEIQSIAEGRPDIRLEMNYIPDQEVPEYFAASDAVILPYRRIFNSGTVHLAMSLGRAVVAPEKGSIPSVLPDGNIVYNTLAEGLDIISRLSREELEEIGRRNLFISQEKYNWEHIAKRTREMYTE